MKLLNSKGMTFVEILIAVSMLSVLVISFTTLLKTQSDNSQEGRINDMINETSRMISLSLNEKSSCDQLVAGNPNGALNLSSISASLPTTTESGVSLLSATSQASPNGAGVHNVPLNVVLTFQKNLADGKSKTLSQKLITGLAQYNGASFVGCVDSEEELRRESLKGVCEMLGALYQDSGSGTESCDFSSLDPNSQFSLSVKKTLCEELFKGSYHSGSGQCDSLEVSGNVVTKNLKLNQVRLGSSLWRSNFNQVCAGANNFIRSIGIDGSVNCILVKMCTPGFDC